MIPDVIIERVRGWARSYKEIVEIWYSEGDFEEKRDTLFIMRENPASPDLADKITSLEIEIMREYKFNIHLQEWPSGPFNKEYSLGRLVYQAVIS